MANEESAPASEETSGEWVEPLTGPGVTVNAGFSFGWVTVPLRSIFRKLSR